MRSRWAAIVVEGVLLGVAASWALAFSDSFWLALLAMVGAGAALGLLNNLVCWQVRRRRERQGC
jgi:ABC-type uncharacterized transport system permease subunit